MSFWTVPRAWEGETAFLLGGGPSLKGFDARVLRGHGRVIAINNAYLMAPWCDVLFWGDLVWWGWNKEAIKEFYRGRSRPLFVTRRYVRDYAGLDVKILKHVKAFHWTKSIDSTVGTDSGLSALNLAYHFGAARAVLLGFDMKQNAAGENNWHQLHRRQIGPARYADTFLPEWRQAAEAIRRRGDFQVFNATPGSALTVFPAVRLEEVIGETH